MGALEAATYGGLDLHASRSLSRAERMIAAQQVYCAVYFPHDQHLAPIMVQATWLVFALAGLLLAARLAGRKPSLG